MDNKQENEKVNLDLGKRIIYKGDMANESGKGFVFNVRKDPNAAQMFSFNLGAGKLVTFDNSKSYDIVLEDGRKFLGVYESNIGGEFNNKSCRFMLGDGMADAADLASLMANAAARDAQKKADAEAKAAAHEAAKAIALEEGRKLGLVPEAEFKGRGSAAASNLRAELKAAGIKARVQQERGSMCSSLRVYAAEPRAPELKSIMRKYEAGNFDGMTDSYEYRKNAWGDVFGDVRCAEGSAKGGRMSTPTHLQADEYKAYPPASREMHVIGTATNEVGYVYDKSLRDHIVRCVNSHDALIEALRWMTDAYGPYASTPKENRCYPSRADVNSYQRQAMDKARAALKAASEGA